MVNENEIALWILKIITMIQGGFLIGIILAIIFYYAREKEFIFSIRSIHILAIAASHLLLIFATMRTMWMALYRLTDFWFLCVFIGYLLSNFALFVMFTNLREEKKENELLKKQQNDNKLL
jgi:predicted MPP superfamily phosphohydrolase